MTLLSIVHESIIWTWYTQQKRHCSFNNDLCHLCCRAMYILLSYTTNIVITVFAGCTVGPNTRKCCDCVVHGKGVQTWLHRCNVHNKGFVIRTIILFFAVILMHACSSHEQFCAHAVLGTGPTLAQIDHFLLERIRGFNDSFLGRTTPRFYKTNRNRS